MAISIKHAFQSAKADGGDASLVRPSNWNAEHNITLTTNRLMGRFTAGTGAVEEIALGTGLTIPSGVLTFSMTKAMVTTALGYTPVHQGGGTGQGANEVYIGWGAGSNLLLQIDGTNFGATWPINTQGQAGFARYLKQNGADGGTNMVFNWSGQSGQPSWLWGGTDGINMYVYNPANFNVNYAAVAGYADTVDGYHAIDLSQIYKGTNHAETDLPIGTYLMMSDSGMFARNGYRTPTIYTGNTTQYIQNGMGGAGAILSGTWAIRGYATSNIALMQRVA